MSEFRLLTDKQFIDNLNQKRQQVPLKASVFYSSWAGGMTKNPALATLPVDDHMVHRGDAVFEALRFGFGGLYLWEPHWQRLQASAEKLALVLPYSESEMLSLLRAMVKESALSEGLVRIYLARGPGGFSVNPYESERAEVYAVVSALALPPEEQYQKGVKAMLAQTRAKEGLWAQVKSCNYLVNVMAKKEALDQNCDYGITQTQDGEITESSTENLLVYTKQGELLYPEWNNTLKGTTLIRVLRLAESLSVAGKPLTIRQRKIVLSDIHNAAELMLVGTTLGVLPISQFEAKTWSDFSCAQVLHRALSEDLREGVCNKASAAL